MKFAAVALLFLSAIACEDKARRAPAHDASHGGSSGGLTTVPGFEGEIGVTVKGSLGGAPPPTRVMGVTVLVKGGQLRVPLPDLIPVTAGLGLAYFLVIPEQNQVYAVSDNKLQATVIDLQALLAHSESQDNAAALPIPATPVEAIKTGHFERLAGISCEVWNVQLAGVTVDLCVAEQPTPWLRVALGITASKYPWVAELTDGNHLPLRIVTRIGDAEHGRIEVTRIENKAVQASSLQVPSNYAVTTFAQLLESLRPARLPHLHGP